MVTRDTVEDEVTKFSSKISENDFPSDGLVLTYDDIAYGRSLGRTAKFPRILLRSNGRMRSERQY